MRYQADELIFEPLSLFEHGDIVMGYQHDSFCWGQHRRHLLWQTSEQMKILQRDRIQQGRQMGSIGLTNHDLSMENGLAGEHGAVNWRICRCEILPTRSEEMDAVLAHKLLPAHARRPLCAPKGSRGLIGHQ